MLSYWQVEITLNQTGRKEAEMASINVVTLNVGRGFSRFAMNAVYEFLAKPEWDIACLQDVRETSSEQLEELFPGAQCFVPTARHPFGGGMPVGVGIYSRRLPFLSVSAHAYAGHVSPLHDLDGVEVDNRGNARPVDLERYRKTESRVLLIVEVEIGSTRLKVATTHGTWVPGGGADYYQRITMGHLGMILKDRSEDGSLVAAGDFNAPRGGEIHRMLLNDSGLLDCTSPEITNTIDWKMRREDGPNLTVDYFLANHCTVSDVATHFGVSDHAAVSAVVTI